LGGYGQISGVVPDLVVMGKALANGYPIAALGGKKQIMDLFVHPEASKRAFLAGTYNAHPIPTAAAIATIERLKMNDGEVYRRVERLGARLEEGIERITRKLGINARLSRQGSACCLYFMDHCPVDWHDLAAHHDAAHDERMRQALIERGVYVFPLQTKQWSISAAHTESDIETTLAQLEAALAEQSRSQ
jgi:glutamate-1-semialdehyde 2,1-aminomutase